MTSKINDFKIKIKHNFAGYYFNLQLKLLLLVGIIGFIVFDFLIKSIVVKNLNENETVKFLPGLIDIQLAYNLGVAFSFGTTKPQLLITIQIIIICVIMFLFFLTQKKITNIGVTLILAGAFSNLADRFSNPVQSGAVVDYLAWKLFPPYSIFNLADIMVVSGAIVVSIAIIMSSRDLKNE